MSFFSRGKLTIILKDVAKKSVLTMKKSGKKQKQADSKKQSTKNKLVTKPKKKAVTPKKCQEKTKTKEPLKAKVKSVNSLAPSDLETAPESPVATEIHNDSIDFSTEHEKTKESFSDGKKNVNGGVEKQNRDSNLGKQPEKTKDSCSEGEKKNKWTSSNM